MMSEIAEADARTESELARLDPASMHAAGAHYAEIRVNAHLIAVANMDDAEAVRDYVVGNTDLRFTGCHPEDDGYVVTFRA
jgi:hypothetical protein